MKSTKKRMAALVVAMALVFNMVNGCAIGTHLFVIAPPYRMSWLKDFRFITGVVVFFVGFLTNVISDELLHKQKEYSGGTYRMPRGFLFRWISCPNYFGEIVEWLGWALLTWSMAGLSFFVWTCANLIPRALTYHRWYREHFPKYPQKRKAVIPFVL
jgi:3-oxo-5-alpha-steroid 4-dehydrogenase 1